MKLLRGAGLPCNSCWKEVHTSSPSPVTATGWREGRHLRAWDVHKQGWSQSEIEAALGATTRSGNGFIGGTSGGKCADFRVS